MKLHLTLKQKYQFKKLKDLTQCMVESLEKVHKQEKELLNMNETNNDVNSLHSNSFEAVRKNSAEEQQAVISKVRIEGDDLRLLRNLTVKVILNNKVFRLNQTEALNYIEQANKGIEFSIVKTSNTRGYGSSNKEIESIRLQLTDLNE